MLKCKETAKYLVEFGDLNLDILKNPTILKQLDLFDEDTEELNYDQFLRDIYQQIPLRQVEESLSSSSNLQAPSEKTQGVFSSAIMNSYRKVKDFLYS